MIRQFLVLSLLTSLIAQDGLAAPAAGNRQTSGIGRGQVYDNMVRSGVNKAELDKALAYLNSRASSFRNRRYMAMIDYSKPSTERRLYLFDLNTGKVERHLVAHGRGSGMLKANTFSNRGNSGASSLGAFRTAEFYYGRHGRSLRLDGLSSTNSLARRRAVVMHAAGALPMVVHGRRARVPYVSDQMIRVQGRLGRSLGCPALDPKVAQTVMNKLSSGALLYVFARR